METILTEADILVQESKLYKAIKESDLNSLDELLHKDLLFVIPTGEVITKEIDLKTYRDGALKIDELRPEVENLNIIDDLAVLTLTMELKGKFNNLPFEVTCRYIRFWKSFAEGIKVVGGSGIAI
ncbi:nuclear transport factor 2 family protein [Pedobacter antarcticus]|uniref:nuclear transport factor 2 family protein n=1 Tax=Pedobacter antarcticus TaxID=34086 RepID=UPI002930B15F|nr:nuclear transport factor 2 family protein [Pedobacter antarcticus]